MRYNVRYVTVFITGILLSLFFTGKVNAQQEQSSLISVTPSIIQLDFQIDPAEAELYYKNNTNQPIELSLSASDFTELEDGYKVAFLEGKDAQNYKYRLSSWITFEKNTLIIEPHETEKVKVFINKNALSPGGHYASLLARLSVTKQDSTIAIQGVLSSLLFVRTNTGKENELAQIDKAIPLRDWLIFPKSFLLRFQNTGNTELVPYGTVQIDDFFGYPIARGILNKESAITLPETIRRFTIPLSRHSQILLPGIYTAHVAVHFGKSNIHITKSVQFFSEGDIPLFPILITVIIILIIALYRKATKISKSKEKKSIKSNPYFITKEPPRHT